MNVGPYTVGAVLDSYVVVGHWDRKLPEGSLHEVTTIVTLGSVIAFWAYLSWKI